MLIALVVALQAATPLHAAEDEIVVLGRRLDAIAVFVGKDSVGRFTCDLSGSSGNPAVDGKLCRVAAKCVRKGAADGPAVKSCIDRRKPALLEEFRRERQRNAA